MSFPINCKEKMRGAIIAVVSLFITNFVFGLDGCIVAANAVNLVKERVGPQTPALDVRRALSYLVLGTRECANDSIVAEAWYLRGLLERRVGRPEADSKYSLEQAKQRDFPPPDRPDFDPFRPPPVDSTSLVLASDVREKWAIVVGVGSFHDINIEPLSYTAKDAKDFAELLADETVGRFRKSNIELLLDEKATVSNIRRTIGDLRAKVKPEDLVVVYMASHGSPRALDPTGVSYVIAYDTTLGTPGEFYASSLQMIDLVQDLSRDLPVGRLVLVLDTCFSGDAVKVTKSGIATAPLELSAPVDAPASQSFSAAFRQIQSRPGRVVLTASRANERSYESPTLENGYFTHYLMEVIRETRGEQSIESIFPEVQKRVRDAVRAQVNAAQTPAIEVGPQAGSITIGIAPGTTSAASLKPARRVSACSLPWSASGLNPSHSFGRACHRPERLRETTLWALVRSRTASPRSPKVDASVSSLVLSPS